MTTHLHTHRLSRAMTTHLHTHRLSRATAAALAIAAFAAPAATARPALDYPGSGGSGQDVALEPEPPVVVRAADDGFDWGSAGIGAGAVAGIVLLSLGGVAASSHVRPRPLS